jgi:hypothetical protein
VALADRLAVHGHGTDLAAHGHLAPVPVAGKRRRRRRPRRGKRAAAASQSGILPRPGVRAKCCGCTEAFQASRAGSIPVARFTSHGEWRSLVAHPAGGRAVAGSNPVSPTPKSPACAGFFGSGIRSNQADRCTVWIWYTLDFRPSRPVNAAGLAAAQHSVVEFESARDFQAPPRPRSRRRPSATPWSARATSHERRSP